MAMKPPRSVQPQGKGQLFVQPLAQPGFAPGFFLRALLHSAHVGEVKNWKIPECGSFPELFLEELKIQFCKKLKQTLHVDGSFVDLH